MKNPDRLLLFDDQPKLIYRIDHCEESCADVGCQGKDVPF